MAETEQLTPGQVRYRERKEREQTRARSEGELAERQRQLERREELADRVRPSPSAPSGSGGGGGGGRSGPSAVERVVSAPRGAGWSSPASARKLVLLSILGLSAIAFYRSRRPETDVNLYRRLWGVGMLGLMLSVLADFAPSVAGPFALLVLLGSLTHGGDVAIQNALANVGQKIPAGGQPAAAATGAGTPSKR